EPGDLEADVGAAEIARHVRLAEKISRRVTIEAAAERHEIFAALDHPLAGGSRHRSHGREHELRRGGEQQTRAEPRLPSGMLQRPRARLLAQRSVRWQG